MIWLLALIAFYAPSDHRATWFALRASFSYLIERASYGELGTLLIATAALGLFILCRLSLCLVTASNPYSRPHVGGIHLPGGRPLRG